MINTQQKLGKYEFPSKVEFDIAFNSLFETGSDGNKIRKFNFSKPVHLVIGNQTTYNVDMAWWLVDEYNEQGILLPKQHPAGWGNYSIELNNEGSHCFSGVEYLKTKI